MTTASLIRRNINLFFRDKASVFFSLLSVVIIIVLYAAFLGNIQVQNIEETAGKVEGAAWLVNSWILAGILSVSSVTIAFSAYGNMVDDVHGGQVKDFFVAPIPRGRIVSGYMVSAGVISLIMNMIAFIISEGYILLAGGHLLEPLSMLAALGVLILCIFSFSSVACFITSFVKTPGAFGTMNTIIGTMIGFVAGIYVPLGLLPGALQIIMKIIPFSYGAVLLREIFTAAPTAQVFAGAPPEVAKQFNDFYGVNLYFGTQKAEFWMMALIVALTGVVFFGLSVWRLSRRSWIKK